MANGRPLPIVSDTGAPDINDVKSYQKIMKTGRAVVVRNYQRHTADMPQSLGRLVFLGRPAIAAKPGTFAGSRSTPGLWHITDPTLLPAP